MERVILTNISIEDKRKNKLFRALGRSATTGVVLALTLSASASDLPTAGTSPSAAKPRTKSHWFQVGKASWYGLSFQGRRTSSGEKFDMNQMTCAHRTLPLGSWVRVTNLNNSKSILLRVNDRGPMVEGRIIDLSYAAARMVGISGLGRVSVESVSRAEVELAKTTLPELPNVAGY